MKMFSVWFEKMIGKNGFVDTILWANEKVVKRFGKNSGNSVLFDA